MKRFMKSFFISLNIFILFLVQFLIVLPKPVYATVPYEASDVIGQRDFNSDYQDNTYPKSVGLYAPGSTAVDEVGHRLFVGDGNSRVLVYNLDGNNLPLDSTADFVLGQSSFSTSSQTISQSGLYGVASLVYDSANNRLFVDSFNNRVLVFDTGSLSNNMDASYVLGQPDFVTSSIRTTQKGFFWPIAVAFDGTSNFLYVADTYNNRVLVFDTGSLSNNMDASYVLGQSDFITSGSDVNAKGFEYIWGLSIDENNQQIYISESNRILVFDTGSLASNMDASYVLGQPDFISNDSDTNAQGFSGVLGLTYVSNGLLYVADSDNRVLVFDTIPLSNNMDAIAVIGQAGFTTRYINDQISPNDVGLSSFGGMSTYLDPYRHRLFVSDGINARVLVYGLDSSNTLVDKTADYVLGQLDFNTTIRGDDSDSFYYPGQLAYDAVNDYLFVTDTGQGNCRVMVYDVATITNGEVAIHALGSESTNTAGGCGSDADEIGYGSYGGVAYDNVSKHLFVNDVAENCRIMVFDLSSGVSDGMDASYVLGATDPSVAGDCALTASSLSGNYGTELTVDEERRLLFVNLDDQDRVLVFDIATITNNESAVHVLGQPDFTTSGENVTQAGLSNPLGIAFDPDNHYLFVNQDAGRVSIFDTSSITDGMNAIGVLGNVANFESRGDNWAVSQVDLYSYEQSGMTFDTINRRLYIAEDGNARVLIFNFVNITNSTLLEGAVGTSYSDSVTYTGTQGTKAFAVTTGSLPTGLSLNSSTGEITGTPTTPGSSTFTITLTDDNGAVGSYTDTQEYTLTISGTAGTSSTSSPKPDGQNSTTEAPRCTDQVALAPDLFQVDRSYNAATVHFTPLSDNVSSYLISYGTDDKAEGYSVELPISHSDGVISQTINELNPSSSYSFKVRAQKGCMPGDWSSIKKDNVRGSFYSNTTPLRTNNANTNINTNTFEQTNTPNPTMEDPTTQPTTTTQQDSPKPKNTQTTPNTQTSSSWFDNLLQWVKSLVGT